MAGRSKESLSYECPEPECKRYISTSRKSGRHLYPHLNNAGNKCPGSGREVVGLPSKMRSLAERQLQSNDIIIGVVINTMLSTSPKKQQRISVDEGLCGVCKTWHKLLLNGTMRKHGPQHEACEGSCTKPDKTRPRGAWKKRANKPRSSHGEAADKPPQD